ncbi:hypothetical protein CBM2592_A220125 [Cupriavidus taiwanensis]|nr:hypothetical protein CBM2592_A220125 [Cupriavidus taiwanensis]SOY50467.1 hypothetical protein CBM2588_A180121 [Cupriavidus taiwanensis]SOY83631.1 hypothetical protein CBM2591_A260124 [Cupriavidus taiwanensis]SOZ57638.1 hypothetical protein CBM2617_A240124 [Cupriavidus taiwanensis]SOZ79592.1 hypothetical protein CBM2618_A220123 [Cupriavidus taiwanensis]
MPADRGKRGAAAADRGRDLRDPGGGAARPARGPGARAPAAGGEGRGDGRLQRQPAAGAGSHDRDRGGRGRAQCLADGDRACRALRPGAAAPAARPGRARQRRIGVPADVPGAAVAHRARAPGDHARDNRRLRDCAARPGDPWPGRIPRRAPVGRGDVALCRPADRCLAGRVCPGGGRADAGALSGSGGSALVALAGRARALPEGLTEVWLAGFVKEPAHAGSREADTLTDRAIEGKIYRLPGFDKS